MVSHPNREAYVLLTTLIQRMGMRRCEFLQRLADLGHCVSDDTFTNWGRAGRGFPRDWALLRDMIAVLRYEPPDQRCSAAEALQFLGLAELPFTELRAVVGLFPEAEFHAALQPYLSPGLHDHTARRTQSVGG